MFRKKFSLIILLVVALVLAVIVSVGPSKKTQESPLSAGYASDFSWVQGELERNPLEGGFWQIRFGSQTDPYGGKFVLGNDPKLKGFKNGDLVFLKGRIATRQVSIYMSGWLYEIEEVKLLR